MKNQSSRLLRRRLKLEEYDYEVVYKTGAKNTNADIPIRIKVTEVNPEAKDNI